MVLEPLAIYVVFQQTLTDVVPFLGHTNTRPPSRLLGFLPPLYSSNLPELCKFRHFQCDSALTHHTKIHQRSCKIFAGLGC